MLDFRRQGISEILSTISKIKNQKERQDALGSCAGIQPVIAVLHAMFHPEVKFLLPEGAPAFKKLEKSTDAQGTLYREAKKLYLFIEGLGPDLHDLKRQTLFVQLLESVDPDDAELILAMKDKKCPYPGITYELVSKTFPGLLPDRDVLDLDSSQIVSEGNVERKPDRSRAKPCPLGCKSESADSLFLPGPLARHMKSKHPNMNG